MKKISIMLLVMFTILFAANAQEERAERVEAKHPQRHNFEDMQKRQLKMMTEALSLTEAQVEKVKVINEDAGKNFRALIEKREPGQDREAIRKKMNAIRLEQNKKLKEVLTEEQYNKWIQLQKESLERRHERKVGEGNQPSQNRGQGRGNKF